MNNDKQTRSKGKAHSSNHKQLRYSSDWIKRGLDLAKTLELSNVAEKDEKISLEDVSRQKFSFNKDSQSSVGENILYQMTCRIFPDQLVMRHHKPAWLLKLELDIYLPALNLAFEYQGEQHFHPIEAWGGEEALKKVQERDKRKAEICKKVGVKLITVSYTDPLTEDYLRRVLVEQSVL